MFVAERFLNESHTPEEAGLKAAYVVGTLQSKLSYAWTFQDLFCVEWCAGFSRLTTSCCVIL